MKLYDLKKEDILKQPVWEHWYNEKNEELIKPSSKLEILDSDVTGYIVITEFLLNNGMIFIGFCSPKDPSGLDYIQPVIVLENSQINFCKDNLWTEEENVKELKKLNLEFKVVFLLIFKCKVKSNGIYYKGILVDFHEGN